ncbi:tolloid-like protein 2 isoform X2 [Halichondria panicea]|uniref:tolloid-like protein 2 isoform X2 n=1 Tax=Halichondria panicea TaxID=6063 RepID=UPI00312B6B8B
MQPTSPLQNLSYWLLLLLCTAASIMEGSPTVSSLGHICTEQDTGLLDQPTAQTWPNGIIPYEISNHLSGDVRRKLLLTMQAQEITSCVIFTPHGSEPDFVSFETGERCCSNIGYIGQGRQDVLLGNSCTESGSENQLSSVIHMLVGMKDTGIATDGNPKKRQTSAKLESFSATINHNCDAICGGCAILDKSNNLIEHLLGTPQYPGHYQTHLDCTWKLAAPEGFSLRLNFHDLDLEEHDSCRHDYLSVQYLNDHGQVLRSSKLCGSPDMLTLNQPTSHDVNISIAVLHFHSDSSYGGKGLLVGYTVREKPVNKVDPCSMNNGGCAGVCTSDAFGDHVCSCKPGYRLTRRGKCLDINECKVNKGGCVHKCTNIEGSFSCHCRIGYELSPDQRSCHTCNFTMNQRTHTHAHTRTHTTHHTTSHHTNAHTLHTTHIQLATSQ